MLDIENNFLLTSVVLSRWVPFDIAKPLLDRKQYVVLSDFATLQNEESSTPSLFENHMEVQPCEEESNDVPIDEDEEMSELDFEDSDDESSPETTGLTSIDIEDGGVSNIMIGLKGSRLRYKVHNLNTTINVSLLAFLLSLPFIVWIHIKQIGKTFCFLFF